MMLVVERHGAAQNLVHSRPERIKIRGSRLPKVFEAELLGIQELRAHPIDRTTSFV